jgi:electron transfer flavoprotein alpha subunit
MAFRVTQVKIVCLIKQVPRADAIEFDPETKSLKREGVPLLLNPFDAAAVAHAATLREQAGGEVIAITMGPPQAEEALRVCLALGADRCIHLSDRVFAVADTIGTSRTLALAIQKDGDVDLVVCGLKTTDSETWQVPPETAAFLDWPHLTSVVTTELDGRRIRATRETEAGYETYELEAPAVLSLSGAREAHGIGSGSIDVWTAADLVDDLHEHDKRFGQTGSPTRVLAVRDVTPPRAGVRASSVEEAVEAAQRLLAERAQEPTQWDKPAHLGEKPGKSYDAWTLVELVDDRPSRTSLELLAKGRELSGKLGGDNVALVLGSRGSGVADPLAAHGADRIVVVDDNRLDEHHPELSSAALIQVLQEYRPHVLVIPATANGRDVGPRAAGELQLGMTGDCVNLNIDRAGRLIQTKPAYGGNIVSVIMGATTPQLATVRPRMFDPLESRNGTEPRIERFAPRALPQPRIRLVERSAEPAFDLDESDLVVLLGPDAQASVDNAGAAVAGTREVCESGALPRNRQVGLYGRAVAPRVLVALGVPGTFEQLTGIVKAGVIVSCGGGEAMEAKADIVWTGDPGELIRSLSDRV